MVLPLLLMAGGLAAAGSFGRTALDDYLSQRAQEGQQARFREALAASTQTVPGQRPDPGFVGPMPPQQQIDPNMLAQQLAMQGDPMGMEMLAGQASAGQQFARQQALQRQRDAAAMDRTLIGRAPGGASVNIEGLGRVPVEPVAIGSSDWMGLEKEGAGLARVREVMDEFRDVLQQQGTESWGATANKLQALRNEMIYAIAGTTEAGALGEQELEFFGQRIPDPTRWTPETFAQEAGKLEAMADWFNSQVRSYQTRSRMTGGLPEVRMYPSASLVPEDWEPVDEADIGPAPERAPSQPLSPRAPVPGIFPGDPLLLGGGGS